jgi:hypothetical protein
MNRPVLLHVGFHKTGTTYLQDHVFDHPHRGFRSPWSVGSGEAVEHFVLTHPSRFCPQEINQKFFAASDALNLDEKLMPVISHEDLCGYPQAGRYYGSDAAKRLHDTFPDARILIGVREQKAMLRSTWGQYIRSDGDRSIEEFFGNGAERTGFRPICRLDHFEYPLLVNQYIELFGRDRVQVLPFELLRLDPLAYEQTVHKFCDTKLNAETVHSASNVGFGARTLSMQRKLNRVAKMPWLWDGDYNGLPLLTRAKLRTVRLLDRFIPKSWHEKEEKRIRDYIASVTGTYFRESNRELAEISGWDLASFKYDL